jgi:hypothetical protein
MMPQAHKPARKAAYHQSIVVHENVTLRRDKPKSKATPARQIHKTRQFGARQDEAESERTMKIRPRKISHEMPVNIMMTPMVIKLKDNTNFIPELFMRSTIRIWRLGTLVLECKQSANRGRHQQGVKLRIAHVIVGAD